MYGIVVKFLGILEVHVHNGERAKEYVAERKDHDHEDLR
jgi:hypothetical protein